MQSFIRLWNRLRLPSRRSVYQSLTIANLDSNPWHSVIRVRVTRLQPDEIEEFIRRLRPIAREFGDREIQIFEYHRNSTTLDVEVRIEEAEAASDKIMDLMDQMGNNSRMSGPRENKITRLQILFVVKWLLIEIITVALVILDAFNGLGVNLSPQNAGILGALNLADTGLLAAVLRHSFGPFRHLGPLENIPEQNNEPDDQGQG